MNVILVEDDEFKAADINRVLTDTIPDADVSRAASVNSALKAITVSPPELMILDMSLPTFDLTAPGGGGSPQGQGGVEVLRLSRRLKHKTKFIVVTQYPEIEIDGVEVPLLSAAKKLSDRFSIDVSRCVAYDFERDDWRAALIDALRDTMKVWL